MTTIVTGGNLGSKHLSLTSKGGIVVAAAAAASDRKFHLALLRCQ
jgi:hypothetical protein